MSTYIVLIKNMLSGGEKVHVVHLGKPVVETEEGTGRTLSLVQFLFLGFAGGLTVFR